MYFLHHLQVRQFKNHPSHEISFSPGLNAICGKNGAGKTNLLDAIHYLCLTKSYFNAIDTQNIRDEENYFTLQGDFEKDRLNYRIFCGVQRGSRKVLKCNDVPYERINEHIGILPLIMNTPDDAGIVTEGSEARRRLIDNTLSQTSPEYLNTLIRYNRLLEQRNAQLRMYVKNGTMDTALHSLYDEQLAPLNAALFGYRKAFMETIAGDFLHRYYAIADIKEPVSIRYRSEFFEMDYLSGALRSMKRDMALGYSTCGIHRDDIELQFHEQPAKKWASQGQQKTILLALRLAQLQYMFRHLGVKPILLLDDIFDKLDRHRSQALIDVLQSEITGQVIVTHTQSELVKEANCIELN